MRGRPEADAAVEHREETARATGIVVLVRAETNDDRAVGRRHVGDDPRVGEAHEASSLTAELKLKRDVHDFLVRAHAEKWP